MTELFPQKFRLPLPYVLIAICACLLICLNILRIIYVPVTYDEAFTYNWFASKSYSDITGHGQVTANNHVLNSILTRFFITSFADNAFFLRLASLIAQVAFIVFSILISHLLFTNKWLTAAGFLLLNLHPFLFEFWGLCRGYGSSISFMLGAIYFLMRYVSGDRKVYLILCMLFSVGAILANFALLNILPAIFFVTVAQRIIQKRPGSMKVFLLTDIPVMLGTAIVLFLLVAGMIKKLKDGNCFFYGGDKGLFTDTTTSLVMDSFYLRDGDTIADILPFVFVGGFAVVAVYWVWQRVKSRKAATNLDTFFVMLGSLLLCMVLQNALFSTKYVISRTALFILVLYMLLLLSFIQQLPLKWRYIILPALTVVFAINFIVNYNISTTRTWDFDRYDLMLMKRMATENKTNTISLGSCNTPVFEYYAHTSFKGRFSAVEGVFDYSGKDTLYDYYYINSVNIPRVPASYFVDTVLGEHALVRRRQAGVTNK